MSNTGYETPLSSTTAEWSGQYSFLSSTEPVFAAQAFNHADGGSGGGGGGSSGAVDSTPSSTTAVGNNGVSSSSQTQTRPSTGTTGDSSGNVSMKDHRSLDIRTSPLRLHQRCSIDPYGTRQLGGGAAHATVPTHLRGKTPPTPTTATASDHPHLPHYIRLSDGSRSGAHDSDIVCLTANPLSTILHQHQPDIRSAVSSTECHLGPKDDDDDLIDDDEISSAGIVPPAQTGDEQTAHRRKIKRFR